MRGARLVVLLAAAVILGACSKAGGGGVTIQPVPEQTSTAVAALSPAGKAPTENASPTPPLRPIPNPLPCDDPLVPIDKVYTLAPDCVPPDLVPLPAAYTNGGAHFLRREAAEALIRMLDAARAEGYPLFVVSAYRSYEQQVETFRYWVSQLGEAEARRTSAEPGHSEHQLGTTVDLSSPSLEGGLDERFGETPEGRWLQANAWRYGFALSYPPDREAVTGYAYEPWHWRYLGPDVAARWFASGRTVREFLLALWQER